MWQSSQHKQVQSILWFHKHHNRHDYVPFLW
jgi:hypothetical protein